MKVTFAQEHDGQPYSLEFDAPGVTDDLTRYDVEARIAGVLRRELQRFAEIVTVALQDRDRDQQLASEARMRKARGETLPAPTGGHQVLAAGTKAPEGRVVLPLQGGAAAAPKGAAPAAAPAAAKARR